MTSFFGSIQFVVGAGIAVAILAGAAGAYYLGVPEGAGFGFDSHSACDPPNLSGTQVAAAPEVVQDGPRRRTVTYAFDAAAFAGGALDLCVDVGEILVEPTDGTSLIVEFVVFGDREEAVSGTEVDAEFRTDGDRLMVGAWESVRGRNAGVLRGDSAEVRLVLRVPASGAYGIRAENDVGDVRVTGLMISEIEARTDVGTVLVREVDLAGNATLVSDVGDAILHATSVQTGKIVVRADVGNTEAALPSRADVGYDAHASTDVGDALILIGETESQEGAADGAGEDLRARNTGFAAKPTRVVVSATTNVGDARITAE